MKELHELADNKRKKAEDLAQLLDKKAFELAADPTRRVGSAGARAGSAVS